MMEITELSKKDGNIFLKVTEDNWFEIDPQCSNDYNLLYTGQKVTITYVGDENEYPYLLISERNSLRIDMRKIKRSNPSIWQE